MAEPKCKGRGCLGWLSSGLQIFRGPDSGAGTRDVEMGVDRGSIHPRGCVFSRAVVVVIEAR